MKIQKISITDLREYISKIENGRYKEKQNKEYKIYLTDPIDIYDYYNNPILKDIYINLIKTELSDFKDLGNGVFYKSFGKYNNKQIYIKTNGRELQIKYVIN